MHVLYVIICTIDIIILLCKELETVPTTIVPYSFPGALITNKPIFHISIMKGSHWK